MSNIALQSHKVGVGCTESLFAGLSGHFRAPTGRPEYAVPLVVALHGGTYNSTYFDLPGHSLLERASNIGIPVLAPDRPGYGGSPMPPAADRTIRGQARILAHALEAAWAQFGGSTAGIVLVGHSIGGAIATAIAAESLNFPLLGLAVSGLGLRTPPESLDAWSALPDTETVLLPTEVKDHVMFGPPGSFEPNMPAASHAANAPVPRIEILDIVSTWHRDVRDIAARVAVPVHYRQAEIDRLWIVDENEVRGFAAALHCSPRVDAALVPGAGHCIDFHRVGAAFQYQQIGFALQCACDKPRD